jgi:ribonuclease HI
VGINLFTDGACTGNGTKEQKAGLGIVIEWQGKKPSVYSIGGGNITNNEAEYSALLKSLVIIKEEQLMDTTIHSDSNLMVQQINGNWKCKDEKLKPLLKTANNRIEWLKERGYKVEVVYIPRELNLADKPAKNGKSLKEGEVVKS